MNRLIYIQFIAFCLLLVSCNSKTKQVTKSSDAEDFPRELVDFVPNELNPIFSGTNGETWDQHIRERGFILYEDSLYKMWYSGYKGGDNDPKSIGYATSTDGINWTKYPQNPLFSEKWSEDMFVLKMNGIYYMYAEGENYKDALGTNDIAHLLTSSDGIYWQEKGNLIILDTNGDTIPGPYGTPAVLVEDGKWYLFYERNDEAIWLAESTAEPKIWTNVTDEAVLKPGTETYDAGAVATNQVIKYKEKYYMYYHGSSNPDWDKPNSEATWSSNVAMSTDMIHWVKYSGKPVVEGDHSSPILVPDGDKFRLYTMHDQAWLYLPK
ncbi:MAG: glycosylase [Draconibacterium sp.]|nr:glycosylase [Draconibacterium sp.]